MNFLLFLWQLPQNLIGRTIAKKAEFSIEKTVGEGKTVTVYYVKTMFDASVCFGDYIILDYYRYCGKPNAQTVLHEYGHSLQSKMLGWLYLPVIGLPSVIRNLYDRHFHKKWNNLERIKWYYNGFPEKQADLLGNVTRW